ncbi:MAG: hypothetical protein ACI9EW_000521 [Cellvibrionaceae bacterium]|jgi:hypothetical protein
MNPVIGQCPICQDQLQVTQLHCDSCNTTINGQFSLGRLHHLSSMQLEFIEVFIRCEGKINRVEQELGLSYPAVRARLSAVILSMGYEVGDPVPDSPLAELGRQEVLAKVAAGEISAVEAAQFLRGN